MAAAIDLRGMPFMPLYIERLQKSKAWLLCKREPELAFYLMNLWMRAWQEVPAGTLENDDDVLADAAMCELRRWIKIKAKVLRGWDEEGVRLSHHVVKELAVEAWEHREAYRKRTEKARQAKLQKRTGPETSNATNSVTENETTKDTDNGTDNVTRLKGQGQGQGQKEKKDPVPIGTDAGASLEAEVFRRGKALLGKHSGGQITKLRRALGNDDLAVLALLNEAKTKENPAEWVAGVLKRQGALPEFDELGLPKTPIEDLGKETDELYRRMGVVD